MALKDPEARKAYIAEYAKKNKEKLKAKRKEYYEANKEKIIAKGKVYVEANREKTLAYKKQWYQDNKEQFLIKVKEYKEKNKEHLEAARKVWLLANHEHVKDVKKAYVKKQIDMVSDYYVRTKLRKGTALKSKDIPQELVEAKRLNILIKRKLNEIFPKGERRNPEKRKAQQRAHGILWREINKEYKRARDREYRLAHKERRNEVNRLSRARVKARKEAEAQSKLNQEGVAQ